MTIDVTVIIPTFNRAHLISQSLQSVLGQTLAPKRVIVVNDGCTDATLSLLEKYKYQIDIINQENLGKSASVNAGVRAADTEWLWIFDDDDVAYPDALQTHDEAISKAPYADFTFSARTEATMNSQYHIVPGREIDLPKTFDMTILHALLDNCFFHLQGSIIRRACFEKLGGFRDDLYRSVDYEFMIRLARNHVGARIDRPTYYLRRHSGTRGPASKRFSAEKTKFHWYENEKKFFKEIYENFQLQEYLPNPREGIEHNANFQRAMITRAGAMARKGLWKFAIRDLEGIGDNRENINSVSKYIDKGYIRKWLGDAFENEQSAISLVRSIDLHGRFAKNSSRIFDNATRIYVAQQLYFALKRSDMPMGLRERVLAGLLIYRILGLNGLLIYINKKLKKHWFRFHT